MDLLVLIILLVFAFQCLVWAAKTFYHYVPIIIIWVIVLLFAHSELKKDHIENDTRYIEQIED